MLAFCAFVGVMLVDAAGSFAMNELICGTTATTIIVLMFFVADMDDVTRGIFVVDLHGVVAALNEAREHIDLHSQSASPGDMEALGAPKAGTQFTNPIAGDPE